ncbi:MAG: AmmeMemoRadiSam system radical SAM enzyme [Chlamydiota bacterium]
MNISRREFIARSGIASCALALLPRGLRAARDAAPREAMHYDSAGGGLVRCRLCPRGCVISPGLRGHCEVRRNDGGKLSTLVFGRPCTFHNDPIEKKPLFHYLPGTNAFSLATAGCNIECRFCQNWEISQARPEEVDSVEMPPEAVVERAIREGSPSIAYTYSEPVVFYEYVYETAKLGKSRGLRSVMITNGFIQEKPMRELLPHLAAVKVDLKAFTEKFYRDICDGALAPVLATLKLLKRTGAWHEVVVLLVPTLNDSDAEITGLCRWMKNELGPGVPVHFTRYHPTYKIRNLPPTPVATLDRAREIGMKEGLQFVYLGNVPGHPGENTWCPKCKKALITRVSYHIDTSGMKDGACRYCRCPIPGVWA